MGVDTDWVQADMERVILRAAYEKAVDLLERYASELDEARVGLEAVPKADDWLGQLLTKRAQDALARFLAAEQVKDRWRARWHEAEERTGRASA